MKNFFHFDAKTVREATEILSRYSGSKVIAGGTDLLGALKDSVYPILPEVLVNIKTIPELNYIREDEAGLKIGALATLFNIETNPIVREKYPILAEAAHAVGSPAIRSMGTIGGNLCQHVRCWYYRSSGNRFYCFRKGGAICYGVPGDNRYLAILGGKVCFAVCPSDTVPALVALGASAKIVGTKGERIVPLKEFFLVLGTVLAPDEILTEIQVPKPKAGTKQKFLKFALRKAIDFAISSVAAVITVEAGAVKESRIVLGGVAPTPYRATKAEDALKGKSISESVAEDAAKAAVADAMPLSMNAYKASITKALVKRAILA